MKGSLVCVGVGMTLGSHLTPLSRSYIEKADVVFTALSDGIIELWIAKMNRDVRSLQQYYREGKSRRETYEQMVQAMLAEVRAGKQVCGAFYGHPGVFALPSHKAIELARSEGYVAHMEPGVSAEDCLYADLGIDPGQYGCQHYEASQLLFHKRRIDPSAYLIVWQVGVAGDKSLARFSTGSAYRQVLVDVLARDYPLTHEVILYRATTLPMQRSRMERVKLGDLPTAAVDMHVTMVVPPAAALEPDRETRARLAALDALSGEGAVPSQSTGLEAAARQFETERLLMRPMSQVDQSIFEDLYTDAQTMRYIGPPLSRERAAASFQNYLRTPRATARQLFFAIIDKADGQPIGINALQQLDGLRDRAEAGIMVKPSLQARGFAKESLAALVEHAFRWLPIEEVWAQVDRDHAVVERLVLGVGFVRRNDAAAEREYPAKYLWSIRREN